MTPIHFKDDFGVSLRLRDASGKEVSTPDFDWTARFWTAGRAVCYTAGQRSGVLRNAYVGNDGRVHIVFDSHGLAPGELRGELTSEFPDATYPDGFRRKCNKIETDIELTRGDSEYTTAEVEATLGVVIRSAMEAEALMFGEVLDKINARLEKVLEGEGGGNGQLTVDSGQWAAGPQVLQRGMISLGAKPGVVYRNLGYIRVPLKWSQPDAEGYRTGTVDADLSGVDLDCVVKVWFDRDIPLDQVICEPIIFDRENKRLQVVVKILDKFYNTGNLWVRLILHQPDERVTPYICRMADGKIRPMRPPYKPAEVTPAAPQMPWNLFTTKAANNVGEFVRAIFGEGNYDIESKYSAKIRLVSDGARYRQPSRWHRVSAKKKLTRGVLRVRYAGNKHRLPSDWVYLSYKYHSDGRAIVHRL